MAKKRYRSRPSGGRGGSGGGSGRPGGGGRSGGGQGGNKNRRRRRPDGPRRPPGGEPLPAEEGDVELYEAVGMLEMHPNGYGFLRSAENSYSRERSDPFVPGTMIEKFGLREGIMINGKIQPARRQTGPRLREIVDVDGMPPDEYCNVPTFESKTPINPEYWYNLETGSEPLTTRVIDMLAPMGRGQRGLIVAPPRTGKTVMYRDQSPRRQTGCPVD